MNLPQEIEDEIKKMFYSIDTDKNNYIDMTELNGLLA